jgi:uncharacterized protein with PQ loop repeat
MATIAETLAAANRVQRSQEPQFRLGGADAKSVLIAAALAPAHHGVPPVANLCGLLAGCIGISTSWPQVWRLWVGRRHAGLSLTANVLGVLYTIGWLLYGIASHSAVQIATTMVGLVGGVLILAGHVRLSRPRPTAWVPLLLAGLTGLGLAASMGRTTIGLVASASTITGVLPQVVLLARARRAGVINAQGVSRLRWLLAATCNGSWVVYGLIVGDVVIFGNSAIIAALALSVVALATPHVARSSAPLGDYAAGGSSSRRPAARISTTVQVRNGRQASAIPASSSADGGAGNW